jgi:hypothetical protein
VHYRELALSVVVGLVVYVSKWSVALNMLGGIVV